MSRGKDDVAVTPVKSLDPPATAPASRISPNQLKSPPKTPLRPSSANLFAAGNSPFRRAEETKLTANGADDSELDTETISQEIPSFKQSLETFEREWSSIIDRYSNVEDEGDVVDLVSGQIVKNNGHVEQLEDEKDTIWDAMFPKSEEQQKLEKAAKTDSPQKMERPRKSLFEQLGMSESDEEDGHDKLKKKRRVSLWGE